MVMAKEMKLRNIENALLAQGCKILADRGPHTKWGCPCGQHTVPVPRHNVISAGVVRSIGKRMACLPEGWLQ